MKLENKQKICELLLPTLQATRAADGLVSLEYKPVREVVVATFLGGGTKERSVWGDSGVMMIQDILKMFLY